MNLRLLALLLLPVTGCANSETATVPNAAPSSTRAVALTPEQELAKYCRVCVVDKGEKIEEFFPSRLDTKRNGQTYKFCADDCKRRFDETPARYALAAKKRL